MLNISFSQSLPVFITNLLDAMIDLIRLVGQEISALCSSFYQYPLRRLIWFTLLLPVLIVWQLIQWSCLLLDEICFPQIRKINISAPVFVLGPPRSGTTHLHRVLTHSSGDFSTSSAWEVLFAPSVLQKKFLRVLFRVDRKIGNPFGKAFCWVEESCLKAFADTHPGSLRDPEEDYFYLGPLMACTGWMMAFPAWRGFRKLLPGCPEMSDKKRRQALGFYHRCLQKQMYVHGPEKILLSKNASFSSWLDLLPDFFPDARYVICMRTPEETLPSMLSTADQAMKGFYSQQTRPLMREQLVTSMQAHYRVLNQEVPQLGKQQAVVVDHQEIKNKLPEILQLISQRLDIQFDPDFMENLESLGQQSRTHRSRHHYSLEEYDLDAEWLRSTCPHLSSTLKDTP